VRYISPDLKPGYIVKFADPLPGFPSPTIMRAYVIIGNNLYTFEYSDDPFDSEQYWSDVVNTITSLDLMRN
jgi:hypothetical protein